MLQIPFFLSYSEIQSGVVDQILRNASSNSTISYGVYWVTLEESKHHLLVLPYQPVRIVIEGTIYAALNSLEEGQKYS